MKVILQQDVRGQGKKGQMVEVSDGYARGPVEPVLIVVNRHSRPARPKMGVVVGAEKQIENTIFL